jgi:4-hydroxythreonine-4-phosphate dehydrogenase
MGDPKGIGPEIVRKVLSSPIVQKICRPIVFGDAVYFDWKKSKKLTPKECGQLSGLWIHQAAQSALLKIQPQRGVEGEAPTALPAEGATRAPIIDAMVTAPISKEHLKKGGYPYPGHTEFLAALSQTRDFRMMMMGPRLKVVLVTIHEPIKKVASLLTTGSILKTIEITDRAMKDWFGIKKPRIAVAALNPHAGESGIFGNEEIKIIIPAIRKAQAKRINVSGPYPADTVFYRAVKGEFNVVIALYHDQGLIPLKLLHFEEAVNITLGLPFIRTSVDHGTAFDIAGKGIADPSSLIAAIKTAVELVKNRND